MLLPHLPPSKLSKPTKTANQLVSLRDAVNQLVEDSFLWPQDFHAFLNGTEIIPLDIYEEGNNIVVKAPLPGIKPEDLNIEVHENVLTISGEVKEEKERKEKDYHLRERGYGHFQRSVTLPEEVKVDQAEAEFSEGILTLTLPKTESAKKKKILVKSKPASQK